MPLDAGAAPSKPLPAADEAVGALALLRPIRVELSADGDLGSALRGAREGFGLDAADVAQATRIRLAQILALEAGDVAALPAAPFVAGFVRAYARALGIDPEAAVERWRRERPAGQPALRRPAGLRHEARPRRGPWLALAGAALMAAVIAWNLAQHAAARPRPHRAAIHPARAAAPGQGPARLGAPLPPPPEAGPPPTYATPGLAPSADPAAKTATLSGPFASVEPDAPEIGAPFQPAGSVYGDVAAAQVTLQALKATSLLVRDQGGAILFARQLAAGEAWRAPAAGDLTAEVGNPASIEVYVDGRAKGALAVARTRVADLRS